MPTATLANNVQVSAPLTSAAYTVPSGITTVSFSGTVLEPFSGQLEIDYQLSKDGGTTWSTFSRVGPLNASLAKGGGQDSFVTHGEIDNLNAADQLRIHIPTCTGIWTLSDASITTS